MACSRCRCRLSSSRFLRSDVHDAVDAVVLSPLGSGGQGIMFCGLYVILVGVLLLADAWGASGAGPMAPSMMELWGSAWDPEALDGATGGSTQKSKSIKLAVCSGAPACCDGVAVRAVPPEWEGAS